MNSETSAKPSDDDRQRAEQQFVHALLTGLHEDSAAREQRIANAMQRFAETQIAAKSNRRTTHRNRVVRWLAMAIAVLFAGLCWNLFLQPSQLSAAVDRVEQAAVQPVTRIYDIQLRAELRDGGSMFRRGRLYTQSTQQFVMSIGENPRRPMKFGTDGERDWYVLGRRSGYVDSEGELRPASPFIEERMHRFMLANQFLQSLSAHYEIERLEEAPPSSILRPCSGLLGKRVVHDRRSPVEVRIWADRETGVALHVRLTWDRPFRFKPQEVVMDFVGEKPMDDAFFSLDHHSVADDSVP